MATPTHPHRPSYHHGTEQGTSGHSDWQPWQDGHMCAIALPAYATKTLDADTVSPSSASLHEAQNNHSTPETAFDVGFTAPASNVNGYLDFWGNSESMLPPTGPFVPLDNQFGEWDSLFPSMSFPGTLNNLSSTLNTYGRSTPNRIATNEHLVFAALDDNSVWNIGPSALANDHLLLTHADSYAMPSDNGYGHAMNPEFFENCMSDLHHDTSNSLPPLAMTTQQPLPSTPAANMGLSLHGVGASLQGGREWNIGLQGHGADIPLPTLLTFKSPDNTSHLSNSSLAAERPSLPTSHEMDTVVHTAAGANSSKQQWIMPKSMNAASETSRVGGKNASMQAAKRVGRRGPLCKKKKDKVSRMRHRTACAACFASHVECSEEDPCIRCIKHAKSLHQAISCHKGRLRMYVEVFSPPFVDEHLGQAAIEQFINPLEFTKNEILVRMSTGPSHPSISLWVCEYIPPNENFLYVPCPTLESHDNMQSFASVRSLEYGVLKRNVDQLKPRCLEHIQAISSRETVIGDPGTLSWKILRAICRFQQADPIARKNDLLIKAIMVNRLHYVLGQSITFSADSVFEAVTSLQNVATNLPQLSDLTARVLTRQMKGAMNDLLGDLTKELLDQFNWELRNKGPETWLLCLLTHFILCMCAEQVQMQVDAFIVFRIDHGGDPVTIRRAGTEVCRRLENVVLEHSWDLIRGKLRTLLRNRNPFKYGYQMDEGGVQKEAELNLVNEFRQIMSNHEKNVMEQASNSYFGGSSRTQGDANKFRKTNSGRLLSKYLKKLY